MEESKKVSPKARPRSPEWVPKGDSSPKSLKIIDVKTPVRFTVSPALGGDSDSSLNTYKLYVGLVDPNGDNQRYAFVNGDSGND